MAKVEYVKVPAQQRREMLRGLSRFLLAVKSESEMLQVLHSLFTQSEIVMFGRRLRIADELMKGASYRDIVEKYRVGLSTIRSIDAWLEEAIPAYPDVRDGARMQQEKRGEMRNIKLAQRYILFTWPLGLLDLILSAADATRRETKKPIVSGKKR